MTQFDGEEVTVTLIHNSVGDPDVRITETVGSETSDIQLAITQRWLDDYYRHRREVEDAVPAEEVERKAREQRNRQVVVYDVVRIIDHPSYQGQIALIEGSCGEGAYELKLVETGGSVMPVAEQRVERIGSVAIPTIQVEKLIGPVRAEKIDASRRLAYDHHGNGMHVGIELNQVGVPFAVVGDEQDSEVRVRIPVQMGQALVDRINEAFAPAVVKYETVAVERAR